MNRRTPRLERVRPAAYHPPGSTPAGTKAGWRLPLLLILPALLLAGAGWFVFTAQAVTLVFEPQPDSVAITGGLSLPLGERVLVMPGRYTVVAQKQGYYRLQQAIEVESGSNPVFRFALKKLPGRLQVASQPPGAAVAVDGAPVGKTPLAPVTLAPGRHQLTVRAPRHQAYRGEIQIEGRDKLQTVTVELVPAWAPVTVASEPAGATLVVDGHGRGTTPLTVDLGAGDHRLELRLEGYQPWKRGLTVVADQAQSVGPVQLDAVRGRLTIASSPAGASVRVAGEYRGRTPLTLELAPGQGLQIEVDKAGYRGAARAVTLAAGEQARQAFALEPILGEVKIEVRPADAGVYVDGELRGSGSQTLRLTATAHEIAVRKPGYESVVTTVTPRPGLEQTVTAHLRSEAQARAASIPQTIRSPNGGLLRLLQPGHFTMGAPRRQQGARANEARREVQLTRAYYIGVHEVTNEQYRRFRGAHSSGIVGRLTLDNDDQPVVRISWADAVAYCNWLSDRAGLPRAYAGGELIAPLTTGYRLPTEAEWVWAARFAGGRSLKYPWGDAMPPTGAAGNYADTAAAGLLDVVVDSYTDRYAAAAPVGGFAANALGLFDLGGNVSEWVHDRYSATPGGGGVETDPTGPAQGSAHGVRGSSWRHGGITELRLSYRAGAAAPRDDLGFRVARYAE